MRHESLFEDYLGEEWDREHGRSFKVSVPVIVTLTVEGNNTEDYDDLVDKIDYAISDICDVLYQNKRTDFFENMERDIERPGDIVEVD